MAVISLVTIFATDTPFWKKGWSDTLVVVSVHIDTREKYAILLLLIAVVNVSKVIVEEIGMPVLGFSIYNPDKKVISDFSKFELQFFANAMFTVSGLRGIFMTVVSISQIDIAIWSLIISEAASMITIRILLNEKEFPNENKDYQEVGLEEIIVE
jgi:hypothetical protein